jgi:hypothetical protein
MKRFCYSSIAALGLLITACLPAEFIEVDDISISPPGGYAIDELTAYMNGTLADSHTIRIVWK